MDKLQSILQKLEKPMEYIKLRDLHENPINSTLRYISTKKYEQLKKDLMRDGLLQPLLVYKNEKGEWIVIDGNHRFKAMTELGWGDNPIRCDRLAFGREEEGYYAIIEGDPLRTRFFETIEQGIAWYSLKRNDPGYALYNKEATMTYLEEMGIDTKEVTLLIEEIPTFAEAISLELGTDEVVEDEPPAVDETKTVSQLGEVYQLGSHRLMCGDSTKIEDVTKLMNGQKADMVFTDPPYGVSYAAKNEYLNAISRGNCIQKPIENDHMNLEDTSNFIYEAFVNIRLILGNKASYYITAPQGGDLMMMMMMMQKAEIPLRHCLIWVKNNHVLGRTDYNYKHEPILYGWVDTHNFYGKGQHLFSTWEIDKPLKNDLHPTMKPIALMVNAMLNSTVENNIVADIFGGSGSTLIAAEQTNRTCYMMELDPKYCDVIRKRYAKFIGKEDEWEKETPIVK